MDILDIGLGTVIGFGKKKPVFPSGFSIDYYDVGRLKKSDPIFVVRLTGYQK